MALVFSLVVAWLSGDFVIAWRNQRLIKRQIEEQASHTREVQRRLESMVHLNRQLVEVEDEHSLVEKARRIGRPDRRVSQLFCAIR